MKPFLALSLILFLSPSKIFALGAPPIKLEAENAAIQGSGYQVLSDSNASNGKIVAVSAGTTFTYTVNLPSSGAYDVNVHYSRDQATSSVSTTSISFNNNPSSKIDLSSGTGSWETFADSPKLTLNFPAGSQTFVAAADNWGFHLDYITIAPHSAPTAPPPVIVGATGGNLSGSTSNLTTSFYSSDDNQYGAQAATANAPEVVYQWTPQTSGTAQISTCNPGTNFDTVLYVRSPAINTAPQVPGSFNDDDSNCASNSHASTSSFSVVAGVTYFIIVDSWGSSSNTQPTKGNFVLKITPPGAQPPPPSPSPTPSPTPAATPSSNALLGSYDSRHIGFGYVGYYDTSSNDINFMPSVLSLIGTGNAVPSSQRGAWVKNTAAAQGNPNAKSFFYLDYTSLDIQCGNCTDLDVYNAITGGRFLLRNSSGGLVGDKERTAIPDPADHLGAPAMDIGNNSYVDGWLGWAMNYASNNGYDTIFADNIKCTVEWGWINGPFANYSTPQYQQAVANSFQHMRPTLDAAGKFIMGNLGDTCQDFAAINSSSPIWNAITQMHGIYLEGCANRNGNIVPETGDGAGNPGWREQAKILYYANNHNVYTACNWSDDGTGDRNYSLATAYLTKEGKSGIASLNSYSDWTGWPEVRVDLSLPLGKMQCFDIVSGSLITDANSCLSSPGRVYFRKFTNGIVVLNPTNSQSMTVPLGASYHAVNSGSWSNSVYMGAHSNAILINY